MDLIWGAVDPRGSYISKILHVKMKESGPIGGARTGHAPPRSANESVITLSRCSYLWSTMAGFGVCPKGSLWWDLGAWLPFPP